MKKFELGTQSIEVKYKNRKDIKEGCSFNQDDFEQEIIKSFDNKEEALEELKKYITNITELSGANGIYYLLKEFYVAENDYDEDGEWTNGGDIWAFSPIVIEVSSKPDYETVGTFDNFADAEECLNDLEDGFISFK